MTLTFGPGVTSQSFTIDTIGDNTFEGNETINLALQNPTGGSSIGAPTTAVATIIEDDLPPGGTFVLTSVTYTGAETNPETFAAIVIQRNGLTTATSSVKLVSLNGTAKSNGKPSRRDFQTTNVTVTFNPGDFQKTVSIKIFNDTIVDPGETFKVQLTTPSAGATIGTPSLATVTITDND